MTPLGLSGGDHDRLTADEFTDTYTGGGCSLGATHTHTHTQGTGYHHYHHHHVLLRHIGSKNNTVEYKHTHTQMHPLKTQN